MTAADAIGSAGVFLLLLAFALNLVGRLAHESRAYQALNTVGAGLAAFASYRIGFWCSRSPGCAALLRGTRPTA